MSLIETGDIQTYYEIHGQGPPLLMINGYGDHTGHWFRMLPWLIKSFELVIYDNRGAGRSDAPNIPYTMKMLAGDAVSLMDSLGIAKANIFGISMGGMVAQELALNYPKKVDHLVLGCTISGGINTVYPEAEVLGYRSSSTSMGRYTSWQQPKQMGTNCGKATVPLLAQN